MNAVCLGLAIVVVVADGTLPGKDKAQSLPIIWTEIMAEAETVAKGLKRNEYDFRVQAALWPRARAIAKRYGRPGIETLVRNLDDVFPRLKKERIESVGLRLCAFVIAEVADPDDKHWLTSRVSRWSVTSEFAWYEVSLAAIALYHDDRSRQLLNELAFRSSESQPPTGWCSSADPYVRGCALGLLRGYETESLRADINAALHESESKGTDRSDNQRRGAVRRPVLLELESKGPVLGESPSPDECRRRYHEASLRAALASLDYAAGLRDPAERARYRDFESRWWRAIALGPKGFHAEETTFSYAAWLFSRERQDGDERFLLRLFEAPLALAVETRTAIYLVDRFSDAERSRLQ